MTSFDMPTTLVVVLIALVAIAGVYDLRTRKIPNWLNLSGIILGLGLNTFFLSGHGLTLAGTGLFVAVLVYLPLYLLRGMGAGDVKLMAAVGAIAGPQNWLWIFLATALLGGIVSLVLMALKRRIRQTVRNVGLILFELAHWRLPAMRDRNLSVKSAKALRMPHGAVIAAGSVAFVICKVMA